MQEKVLKGGVGGSARKGAGGFQSEFEQKKGKKEDKQKESSWSVKIVSIGRSKSVRRGAKEGFSWS